MSSAESPTNPSIESPNIESLWAAIAGREARLLTLVKASAQIVWITDQSGNVRSEAEPPTDIADLTWSAFTGIPQAELSGRGWLKAVHADDVATVAATIQRANQTGDPVDCEFRIRHKSGEWRWVICRGGPVRGAHDEIIGWIGTCTDVTGAKRTEDALRESQQRLLAALDAAEMSTWIWKLSDNTFWWDDAGERLWGITDELTMVGHQLADLQILIHADDREAVWRACEETVTSGVARNVEFRTLRPDGRLQWLSSRGRVEHDANGTPVRVIGVFIDVTKLKVAEESLRHAQKMQALGTLAGGIAHDFNNLLLAINGNTQLALSDLDDQHPGHRSLREIAKASTRASDIVRRILAFASPQKAAESVTQLEPAIEEALTLLHSSVPTHVFIRTRFADPTLSCTLAQAELQQIVVNFVNNAIDALGDTAGTIDIEVGPEESAPAHLSLPGSMRCVQLTVRDSGCGMDEATRARIFEPFFTTKPTGKGTGLGLAVVHGIVQGCGGAITVDSEVNRGSRFTLWLPTVPRAPIEEKPATIASARAGQGERILYVDDDEAVNFLVKRLLERAGYNVTCYEDPRSAVALFTAGPHEFDVVVTDLSMPTMSGFDVVRAIRAVRANVPIIMTSGYVREADHAYAASLGIDNIILKPDTVAELSGELDAICSKLRTR